MKTVSNNIFWVFLVIIIMTIGYGTTTYFVFTTWGERGTFGDMFGGLNAIFSGLAFGGIIYTIILQRQELQLQREELKLQRNELELTRQELKRTAEAQEKSEIALTKQVSSMERTAMLNGLNALLVYHTDERNTALKNMNGIHAAGAEKHCRTYITKINLLVEEIEKHKGNG